MGENIKETVVAELHKPARKNYMRRRTIVKGLNNFWQADLVARFNKSYRYILVVINAFTKYVWTKQLKSKSAKDVRSAMKAIRSNSSYPKNLQTDFGKEFYNEDFQ